VIRRWQAAPISRTRPHQARPEFSGFTGPSWSRPGGRQLVPLPSCGSWRSAARAWARGPQTAPGRFSVRAVAERLEPDGLGLPFWAVCLRTNSRPSAGPNPLAVTHGAFTVAGRLAPGDRPNTSLAGQRAPRCGPRELGCRRNNRAPGIMPGKVKIPPRCESLTMVGHSG